MEGGKQSLLMPRPSQSRPSSPVRPESPPSSTVNSTSVLTVELSPAISEVEEGDSLCSSSVLYKCSKRWEICPTCWAERRSAQSSKEVVPPQLHQHPERHRTTATAGGGGSGFLDREMPQRRLNRNNAGSRCTCRLCEQCRLPVRLNRRLPVQIVFGSTATCGCPVRTNTLAVPSKNASEGRQRHKSSEQVQGTCVPAIVPTAKSNGTVRSFCRFHQVSCRGSTGDWRHSCGTRQAPRDAGHQLVYAVQAPQ